MQGSVFIELNDQGQVVASGSVISTANPNAWVLGFAGPLGSTRILPVERLQNCHFFPTPEHADAFMGRLNERKNPPPPPPLVAEEGPTLEGAKEAATPEAPSDPGPATE